MRKSVSLVALVLAASPAFALNQDRHYQIAVDSCNNAGLPGKFCEQVGVETYDVDAYEFDDLSAHGQIPDGATACDAANATLQRELGLGAEIRHHVENLIVNPSRRENSLLAQSLGRALHTAQDNCAHSGMGNPQHAWHSLRDVCHGTSESPDLAPDAINCARWETDAIVSAVVDSMSDFGVEKHALGDVDETDKHYPAYYQVCDFLGGAQAWDGGDRRWDNDIVRPALRQQLIAGIQNDYPQPVDVCAAAQDGILVSYEDDLDVSRGAYRCAVITAFCLGKADSGEIEQQPPYEPTKKSELKAAARPSTHGGCAVGGGDLDAGVAAVLLLLGVAFMLRRKLER